MGEPVNSMEMVHGGGTLSVTSGKTVHFLDIMGYVRWHRVLPFPLTDVCTRMIGNTLLYQYPFRIPSPPPPFIQSTEIDSLSVPPRTPGYAYMIWIVARRPRCTRDTMAPFIVLATVRTGKCTRVGVKTVSSSDSHKSFTSTVRTDWCAYVAMDRHYPALADKPGHELRLVAGLEWKWRIIIVIEWTYKSREWKRERGQLAGSLLHAERGPNAMDTI